MPDATPSHSFLRYLYKYPHSAFPYRALVEENARRSRLDPPFNLMDSGAFEQDRYFDAEVVYAKASPDEIHIRIAAANRGPQTAGLHLLPTLWFRNTWSWSEGSVKPSIRAIEPPKGAAWAVHVTHPETGPYWLYGRQPGQRLFTENESDTERLWGLPNASPYVKDSFHRCVVEDMAEAVNPALTGTKFASWHVFALAPGEEVQLDLVLSARPLAAPFERNDAVLAAREAEADAFYRELLPGGSPEDQTHLPSGLVGHGLEQAVLPLRRRALVRRRQAHASSLPPALPECRVETHEGGRCDLDARRLGISLVRGLGPRLPLQRIGAYRCGLCERPDRADALRTLFASEWPAAGL